MREIKFRGFSVDVDKWVFGDLLQYRIFPIIFDDNFEQHECYASSLGQYTGLKDKDDIEIYEGDILYVKKTIEQPNGDLTHEVTGQVLYRNGLPKLEGKTKQTQGDWENEHESYSILLSPEIYEVIGNIFENPEMIEQQDKGD